MRNAARGDLIPIRSIHSTFAETSRVPNAIAISPNATSFAFDGSTGRSPASIPSRTIFSAVAKHIPSHFPIRNRRAFDVFSQIEGDFTIWQI